MLSCPPECRYLDKELRGVQALLLGRRCALSSHNGLHDMVDRIARALHGI